MQPRQLSRAGKYELDCPVLISTDAINQAGKVSWEHKWLQGKNSMGWFNSGFQAALLVNAR